MRVSEREYDEFPADHFPNMVPVRTFSDCRVWSAGVEQPLLVLVEDGTRRIAVFEYDTVEERQRDIDRIRRMPEGDGETGAGMPILLGPTPPTRSATSAEELP